MIIPYYNELKNNNVEFLVNKVNKIAHDLIMNVHTNGEVIFMTKRDAKKHQSDKKEVKAVENQLFEDYQSGVVEQLNNNKGIHHFNNQKK